MAAVPKKTKKSSAAGPPGVAPPGTRAASATAPASAPPRQTTARVIPYMVGEDPRGMRFLLASTSNYKDWTAFGGRCDGPKSRSMEVCAPAEFHEESRRCSSMSIPDVEGRIKDVLDGRSGYVVSYVNDEHAQHRREYLVFLLVSRPEMTALSNCFGADAADAKKRLRPFTDYEEVEYVRECGYAEFWGLIIAGLIPAKNTISSRARACWSDENVSPSMTRHPGYGYDTGFADGDVWLGRGERLPDRRAVMLPCDCRKTTFDSSISRGLLSVLSEETGLPQPHSDEEADLNRRYYCNEWNQDNITRLMNRLYDKLAEHAPRRHR